MEGKHKHSEIFFFKEEILKRNQILKIKNIKKIKIKIKNISSEMKQSLDRTKSISDTEEEKTGKVEDMLIKNFQSKAKRERKPKEN